MSIEYAGSASDRSRSRTRRSSRTQDLSFVRRIDWVLAGAVSALLAYGLYAIDGITHHDVEGKPHYFLVRQLLFAAAGGVGFFAALAIDPYRFRQFWRPLYIGTVGVMLFVIVAAPLTRGSRRWLDLGFFRFQPSEFGKLIFVLAIAGFLAERARHLNDPRTIISAWGSPRSRSGSSSSSRTSGRRSSTAPRSPRCCSSPGRAG